MFDRQTTPISKRRFKWRLGLMFSLALILLGLVMAAIGRIDYSYHYGTKQVVGVIRAKESPVRFWLTIGAFIAVGASGAAFTRAGYLKGKREE